MTIPRPLIEVDPAHLIKGRPYLIAGVIRDSTPHSQHLKGIFKKNTHNRYNNHYMSHFINVIGPGNRHIPDHNLQSAYWKYYDADATERAATQSMLRNITGDPDFVYTPNPSRKPSASRASSIHTAAPDHSSTIWSKQAALRAAEHKTLEKRIDAVDGKQGGKTMRNRRRRRGCRSLKNKNRRKYSKRRY